MSIKAFGLALVLCILLVTGPVTAAEISRIMAVAAQGPDKDARISGVAARCPYFLFFDENGALMEALANPYFQETKAAGVKTVGFLAAKGVDIFVAGEFGPKLKASMNAKGIAYHIDQGRASDVVRQILNTLEKAP